jgi:hypothetical protein
MNDLSKRRSDLDVSRNGVIKPSSKFEFRNSKQIQMFKLKKIPNQIVSNFEFLNSDFDRFPFVSDFELRISNFDAAKCLMGTLSTNLRRHQLHETAHRGTSLVIGQTAQAEIAGQVR